MEPQLDKKKRVFAKKIFEQGIIEETSNQKE
jgi:hypothetical protein